MNSSNGKTDWFMRTLVMILLGIVGWLWHSMDSRLSCIENRLRRVELNQAQILQKLELTPIFPSAVAPYRLERQGVGLPGPEWTEFVDCGANRNFSKDVRILSLSESSLRYSFRPSQSAD